MESNKEIKRQRQNEIIKSFAKVFGGLFVTLSIIITVLGTVTDFEYLKANPFWISGIFLLTITVISLIYIINKLLANQVEFITKFDLPKEIVRYIKIMYKNKDYLSVVRFGSPLSRFLLLRGNLAERIDIGKMVEDSASKIGKKKEQISALIDDIGWTYAETGDYSKAITNINNGINKAKAKETNLFYYAAKGERHLAGIASKQNNRSEIESHINNAWTYSNSITDESDKNEIVASLNLAFAEYNYENENYPEAEKKALLAKDGFMNDEDRIVKVHSLLGNIYFLQEKYQEAKDEFNNGYTKCRDFRVLEFAKNAVGLAKVEKEQLNFSSALEYLKEAKKIYEDAKKNRELTEVRNLITEIENVRR